MPPTVLRHNRAVAAYQRRLIEEVQAFQPGRRVLVQPLRDTDPAVQAETRWVEVAETAPTEEVWTRTIALNEIPFDIDARPWGAVRSAQSPLTEALTILGVPHLTAWSGGKGSHTQVFLSGLTLPEDLMEEARALNVEAWREARWVVANALLDAAEVPDGDKRWAPPYGHGVFDRTKIWWSASRHGSMLREFGCAGTAGFRKTLAPEDVDEWPAKLPHAARLRFPKVPFKPWEVPPELNRRVQEAIWKATEAARRKTSAPAPTVRPDATVRDAPCLMRFLRDGAPAGARHGPFLDFAARLYVLGYSETSALAFVRAALRACGGGPEHEKVVPEVFSGRWEPVRRPCECAPGSCVFSPALSFSSPGIRHD